MIARDLEHILHGRQTHPVGGSHIETFLKQKFKSHFPVFERGDSAMEKRHFGSATPIPKGVDQLRPEEQSLLDFLSPTEESCEADLRFAAVE